MSIREDQLEPLEGLEPGALDERDLAAALDANRGQIEMLEARMKQLEQALVRARREEHLLEGLLALRRGQEIEPAVRNVIHADASGSNGVTEAAVAVLEKSARPMHIGELMSALVQEGVEIPGAGTQANLIAHLRRDKRIARPSRGMYGLRALGIEEYQPKKRASRRKRTRKPKTRNKAAGS